MPERRTRVGPEQQRVRLDAQPVEALDQRGRLRQQRIPVACSGARGRRAGVPRACTRGRGRPSPGVRVSGMSIRAPASSGARRRCTPRRRAARTSVGAPPCFLRRTRHRAPTRSSVPGLERRSGGRRRGRRPGRRRRARPRAARCPRARARRGHGRSPLRCAGRPRGSSAPQASGRTRATHVRPPAPRPRRRASEAHPGGVANVGCRSRKRSPRLRATVLRCLPAIRREA